MIARVKKSRAPLVWIKIHRSQLHRNVHIPACMLCGAEAEETFFNIRGGAKCFPKCEPEEEKASHD
jgi:hypothetical protein